MLCHPRSDIRRPPLTVGQVMPRISTIQISILTVRTLRKMKRSGGDTVPLGGNIRRPPLAVGPVMPRISTIRISILTVRTLRKMKRSGGDTVPFGGNIRRPPLGSGSSHATNFYYSHLNPRGTHAPQSETEWWGYCAIWGKYKAAALGSRSSHATYFHHSNLNPRGTHAPRILSYLDHRGLYATRRHNKIEPTTAFKSYWVSLISYFHGYTQKFSLEVIGAIFHRVPSEEVDNLFPREDLEIFAGSHRSEITLCSGDHLAFMNGLAASGSFMPRISTSTHLNTRSTHSPIKWCPPLTKW
uniref:Uncharacterized protein n=1 Tax=Vespula pensylvanica TaxID=30213 RepID=A0A834KLS0_VESPE|nr:hypothetical protein H0235_013900 [Vespula pensylvanica]